MHQVSKRSLAALGVVLCLALPPAFACSSTPQNVVCGVGTKQVNGACVPDVGSDASRVDGASDLDGGAGDAAETPDVDTYDAGPDDPCPVIPANAISASPGEHFTRDGREVWINCDASCGAVAAKCDVMCLPRGRSRSDGLAPQGLSTGMAWYKITLRMPRDPWVMNGGVCDPALEPRYPTAAALGAGTPLKPYVARNPQPRSFVYIEVGGRVFQPLLVEPSDWDWRVAESTRIDVNNRRSEFRGRLEPLFDVSDGTPAERDRTGCASIKLGPDDLTPAGVTGPESASQNIVFFTDKAHIRAANITLTMTAGACGAK